MNRPQLRALIEMLQKILDEGSVAASCGTIVDRRPLERTAPEPPPGPAPDDDPTTSPD